MNGFIYEPITRSKEQFYFENTTWSAKILNSYESFENAVNKKIEEGWKVKLLHEKLDTRFQTIEDLTATTKESANSLLHIWYGRLTNYPLYSKLSTLILEKETFIPGLNDAYYSKYFNEQLLNLDKLSEFQDKTFFFLNFCNKDEMISTLHGLPRGFTNVTDCFDFFKCFNELNRFITDILSPGTFDNPMISKYELYDKEDLYIFNNTIKKAKMMTSKLALNLSKEEFDKSRDLSSSVLMRMNAILSLLCSSFTY